MDTELESRVKVFVARETTIPLGHLHLDSALFTDLGVAGVDGWELIEAFGNEFVVDLSTFDPSKHFGSEGSGNPITLFIWFVQEVLQRRDPHEVWRLTPITIRDLVEAAEQKQWLK